MVAVLIVAWQYVKEEFGAESDITFLPKKSVAKFLSEDPDGYVTHFSPSDLYARKVHDVNDYLDRASNAAMDFQPDQKRRFEDAAHAADQFLSKQKEFEGILDIPWVFAMTKTNMYEDGLPHTRTNIIFVSSNIDERHESLVKTLIHEKIHIYQRTYPERMAQFLEQNGYKMWKARQGVPRIRANPDLDPWIYVDPDTQKPMAAYYSSDKPVSISDVIMNDLSFEHPFERIAYQVSNEWVAKSV